MMAGSIWLLSPATFYTRGRGLAVRCWKFAAPANLAVPLTAPGVRLVVRDLNGDGQHGRGGVLTRSVRGGSLSGPDFVTIHFGNGLGGFTSQATIPLGQDTWISTVVGPRRSERRRPSRPGGRPGQHEPTGCLLLGNGAGVFTPQLLSNGAGGIVLGCQWRHQRRQPRSISYSTTGWTGRSARQRARGALRRPVPRGGGIGWRCVLANVNADGRLNVVVGKVTARRKWRGRTAEPVRPAFDRSRAEPDRFARPGGRGQHRHLLGDCHEPRAEQPRRTRPTSRCCRRVTRGPRPRAAGTCSVAGRLVTCSLGLLAPGGSGTVESVVMTTISGCDAGDGGDRQLGQRRRRYRPTTRWRPAPW